MGSVTSWRYVLIVRQWFDHANGNSYFSVQVVDAPYRMQYSSPITYGRGLGQYFRAAEDLLGYPLESGDCYVDVVEVARKKDLI